MIKFQQCTVILLLTLFISCGNKDSVRETTSNEKTPAALQDSKSELISYKRSGDLTDLLYQEFVDKSAELQKLEEAFKVLANHKDEPIDKFNEYNNKSISYYHSANSTANSIQDSLLKKKVLALLKSSSEKYAGKTNELNSLLDQITKNELSLRDRHSILKIVLTVPVIEKFQDDNKPGTKEFRQIIKEQADLIQRTEKLTPAF